VTFSKGVEISALPGLRVLSVVKDLVLASKFLEDALQVPVVKRFRDGSVHGDLYAFGAGELLLVQPMSDDGPVASFLNANGPGVLAFGGVEDVAHETSQRLSEDGALSAYSLLSLPDIGISLFSGPHTSSASIDQRVPVSIDHVAYVVDDLDKPSETIGSILGVAESDAIGRWSFPSFEIVDAVLLFDGSYIELNRPTSAAGPFGGALAKRGPSSVFLCLRADDMRETIARLELFGFGAPAGQKISGIAPDGSAGELGTVYAVSKKATQGMPIMLLDGDWPWRLLR